MPEMLPYDIGEDVFCSEGERKVFEYFKSSKVDGYVIHSLGFDLKGHHEIDYVLVCKRGILCLEVKGGAVRRDNGIWYYVDHNNNSRSDLQGPYVQADNNMFALKEKFRLNFKSGDIFHVQFAYGVVLPDTPFNFHGLDVVREITFDKRMGLDDFDSYLMRCFDYSKEICIKKNGIAGSLLSNNKDLESVKNYFRGDFGLLPDLNSQLDGIDARLNKATEEQYHVLEQLRQNRRILISGGAGTGKTLIAVEHASQLASAGNRVLFLFYNKLVKNSIAKHNPIENVYFEHLDNFLYRHVYPKGDYKVSDEEKKDFYKRKLPEAFFNMGGLPEQNRFDALIVDEAQDILSATNIWCLGLMVKGGLEKGKAAMFYDTDQNIFNSDEEGVLEESVASLINDFSFASFELSKNCRSTRRIADFFTRASRIEPMKFNSVDGVKVCLKTYDSKPEGSALLAKTVKELMKEGIPVKDMIVISHMGSKNQNSCLSDLGPLKAVCSPSIINPDSPFEPVDGLLQIATVQSFKGLEAKVVIVVDVNKLVGEDNRAQMRNYTSFSRAKTHLYVLAHNDMKKELARIINDVG